MRRSVLFTRVFGAVILTIVMTALFTTMVYTYISRSVFQVVKENELLPRARTLGRMLTTYAHRLNEADAIDMLSEAVGLNGEGDLLLGAYVVATDRTGRVFLYSKGMREDYLKIMTDAAQDVLRVGEVRTEQIGALKKSDMVGVGVSIEENGETLGAIMLLVPLYEAMVAMGSLNGALALSLLLSMPFVAAMVYYIIGRIVRPLKQMRDVAVGMAGGNFEARADDSQRGEVGQLGRSLNLLSHELSRSISALVLERNRLQQAFDGLREGIVAVDAEGQITHRNPAVTRLFAPLRVTEAADERMRLIPDPGVWADFDEAVALGRDMSRLMPVNDRTIQLSIHPLRDDDGVIAGAVGLFSDVTESERLERTRRDYVANVSHEMRTPLTAMRALLEPLSEGMVRDEAARSRYYGIMLRETLRLSRLVDDLMELSRLQSGNVALSVAPMSIAPILESLRGKYEATCEDHGLAFSIDIPENCPDVIGNADRIEQVLVIMLDNAMKYTPEGGSISVGAAIKAHSVILSVTDTGIGIDPADQPYVFDRFFKADKAHSSVGSGLGLSIAAELIERMGERIWLTSTPGEGSTFAFTVRRR